MSELTPTARPDDDVRVGDAERRAVDERLHAAVGDGVLTLDEYEERCSAVWAARTRGELAALVRDLPGTALAVPPGGRTRRAIAVMGDERVEGPVGAGQGVEGYAVMGSSHVDLRRSDLPPVVKARAFALMGEVEVLVPDGASVELSGMSLMGDRSVRLNPTVPGAPVVRLQAWAVMGSVKVRSGAPRDSGVSVPAQPGWHGGWQPTGTAVAATGSGKVVRKGRHRGRNALVGLAIAGVAIVGAANAGDGGGPVGDRTVFADVGETVQVPRGVGDVTVVVPDGVRAVLQGDRGVGNVDCETACLPGPDKQVTVVIRGGVGDVEVESRSEYLD